MSNEQRIEVLKWCTVLYIRNKTVNASADVLWWLKVLDVLAPGGFCLPSNPRLWRGHHAELDAGKTPLKRAVLQKAINSESTVRLKTTAFSSIQENRISSFVSL